MPKLPKLRKPPARDIAAALHRKITREYARE